MNDVCFFLVNAYRWHSRCLAVIGLAITLCTVFAFSTNTFADSSLASDATHTPSLNTTYIEFPPVTFTNDQGKPDGYLMAIMRQVLEEAGYRYTIRPYPTNRMIRNMGNGSVDLWIGAITIPELNPHVVHSEHPVTDIHFNAYYTKDIGPITQPEHLIGKRVIIMRGYSYNGWKKYIVDPKNNIWHFQTDDHAHALLALSKGRGDVLLDYRRPVATAMKKSGFTNIQSNEVFSQPLYFLISKKTPNAQAIVEHLDQVHMALKNAGTLVGSDADGHTP